MTESKLTRAIRTIRRYGSVMSWLARDSLLRYRKAAVFVLIADPIAVAFQVQAIGLAIYYGRGLTEGISLDVLGRHFDFRTSTLVLFAVAATVFLLMIASAGLNYLVQETSLRLVRRYEALCTSRIIGRWGAGSVLGAQDDQLIRDRPSLLMVARRDARYLSLMARQLINLISPTLTFLVALSVLCYINFWLTSVILATMAVAVYLQAKVSMIAAKHVLQAESTSQEAYSQFSQFIEWQQGFPMATPGEDWVTQHLIDNRAVRKWRDAYDWRFRSTAASQLISNAYLAFAILVIMLLLGPEIIGRGGGWEALVTYLIALRYALVNMRQVAVQVTGMNRLYPRAHRYRRALDALVPPAAEAAESKPLRIAAPAVDDACGQSVRIVRPGQRLAVLSPFKVNRFELGQLAAVLFGKDLPTVDQVLAAAWFVTENVAAPPASAMRLVQSFDGAAADDEGESPELVKLCRQAQEQIRIAGNQAQRLARWSQLDDAQKVSLSVVAGLSMPSEYLFIAGTALAALPTPARDELFERYDQHVIFVVMHDVDFDQGTYGLDAVVAIDAQQVLGVFEPAEYPNRRETIRSRFESALEARGTLVSATAEFELEEL